MDTPRERMNFLSMWRMGDLLPRKEEFWLHLETGQEVRIGVATHSGHREEEEDLLRLEEVEAALDHSGVVGRGSLGSLEGVEEAGEATEEGEDQETGK